MLILCQRLQPSNTTSVPLMRVECGRTALRLDRAPPGALMIRRGTRRARREPRGPAAPLGVKAGVLAAFLVTLILLTGLPATATAQDCGNTRATPLVGRDAIDGDTFRTTDGREWRL